MSVVIVAEFAKALQNEDLSLHAQWILMVVLKPVCIAKDKEILGSALETDVSSLVWGK